MAATKIYRESWTKINGWNVRVECIPCGGDFVDYSARTVEDVEGVFIQVDNNINSFDKLPYGLADAPACKFKVNYSNAPTLLQDALDSQFYEWASVSFVGNDVKSPNLFLVWSDRGLGGSYYLEYAGCHVARPDADYEETSDGIITDINTVSVHKAAGDVLLENPFTLIEVLTRFGVTGLTFDGINFDTTYGRENKSITRQWNTYNIVTGARSWEKFQQCVVTLDGCMFLLGYAWQQAVNFYLMQPASSDSVDKNNTGANIFQNYKFYEPPYGTETTIGALDVELTRNNIWVVLTDSLIGGLSIDGLICTAKETSGFQATCKTWWELWRDLSEQMFLKCIPTISYTGTYIDARFKFSLPYETIETTTYTAQYDSGVSSGKPKFKRNFGRLGKTKQHYTVIDPDTGTYEAFESGLSTEGYETTTVFNLDIPTDNLEYKRFGGLERNKHYERNSETHVRGLYRYYDDGTLAVPQKILFQISPCVKFRKHIALGFVSDDVSLCNTSTLDSGNHIFDIRGTQEASIGFRNTTNAVLELFGTQANQTLYEMDLPLDAELTSNYLGSVFSIDPMAQLTSIISGEAILIETTISWDAKNDKDDIVKCKFLTKSV